MKKIINAIKNYINDYNRIQAECLQTPGYNYITTQLYTMSCGCFI